MPAPSPAPVTIPNRPFWARLLVPFWAIEVLMGLYFAWIGLSRLGPGENGMAVLLLVMGLLLAAAGVVMTGLAFRVARIRGTALEFTAEGFRDHRLSPILIPWEALRWKVIFNGRGHSLQFDLEPGFRKGFRAYWHQRALAGFNRLFKQPEFTVVTLGTGLNARDIGKRLEAYKAPIEFA